MIKQNLRQIQARVADAAGRANRPLEDVTLIAVSKTKRFELLIEAYEAGQRHFGENRSAELKQKAHELAVYKDIQWHAIGQLQSKQSGPVAENASYFHAGDRLKIVQQLAKQRPIHLPKLPIFLEVNISGEQSKGGYLLDQWEQSAEQQAVFRAEIANILPLPNVQIVGLMTMAPFDANEQTIRTIFKRTADLRNWLQDEQILPELPHLSMGMTDDFEIAIEEGATMIRVGRAIFGG